jgi:nucleotide-binding universal stress UspA family protein
MSASQQKKTIVVGMDGSDQAIAALGWAIRFAGPLGAEIVAVFAVPPPSYIGYGYETVPPSLDPEWRAQVQSDLEQTWCRALRESGLPHRMVMEDGRPARVIADVVRPAIRRDTGPLSSQTSRTARMRIWSWSAGEAGAASPSCCWAASATSSPITAIDLSWWSLPASRRLKSRRPRDTRSRRARDCGHAPPALTQALWRDNQREPGPRTVQCQRRRSAQTAEPPRRRLFAVAGRRR